MELALTVQQGLIVCATPVTKEIYAKWSSFVMHPLASIHMYALKHTKGLNANVHMELLEKNVIDSVIA